MNRTHAPFTSIKKLKALTNRRHCECQIIFECAENCGGRLESAANHHDNKPYKMRSQFGCDVGGFYAFFSHLPLQQQRNSGILVTQNSDIFCYEIWCGLSSIGIEAPWFPINLGGSNSKFDRPAMSGVLFLFFVLLLLFCKLFSFCLE